MLQIFLYRLQPILPPLSLPKTLFMSTPSSLANFLALGLADEKLDTLFITLVCC